ncbi:MAG: restriction endonuclease subunit S [Azoarcus sp.]|jgi:putative addiction module killer protein|nr:restriction endonuclease subunit S [Azoarcus sp.]
MNYIVRQTEGFAAWREALRDRRARIAIERRIEHMEAGNPGDVEPVGDGVSEMRVDVGAGYRLYFTTRNRTVVFLLCGGDKSTQKQDIAAPQYIDVPFWTVDTLFYTEIAGQNSTKYIFYRFCIIPWMNYNEASGVPSLNAKTIESIEIMLPDSIEQVAIATVFSDMDAEISALETRRAKTRTIKQAMMQELLTGRTRLVEPVAKPTEKAVAQTEGRKANIHFLRSVLAAEIIDQLHDQPTFGHVKFEKMIFLVEHLCHVDTGSTYYRKAAGPYDNRALRSIDSQLQKQQWFDVRKKGERYRYVPMQKRGGHKLYSDRYFSEIGDTFGKILTTFRTAHTEQCEIVTTLLAAWSDLLRKKGEVSDDLIVYEVLNNWHESKRRISEDRWLKALGWMREKGFVPKGAASP